MDELEKKPRSINEIKEAIRVYLAPYEDSEFLSVDSFFKPPHSDDVGRGLEQVEKKLEKLMPGFVDLFLELAAAADATEAWNTTVNVSLLFSGGREKFNSERVHLTQCAVFTIELAKRALNTPGKMPQAITDNVEAVSKAVASV